MIKKTPPGSAASLEEFQGVLENLGLNASDGQTVDLLRYVNLLVHWNKHINLVGMSDWKEIVADLVADSFYLARWLSEMPLPESLLSLDLGAGAGLPGIPLRILWQAGHYVLVEPRTKRAVFLRTVLSELGLPRTEVRQERAEEILNAYSFTELLISRAFRPWPELLSLVEGWLSPKGRVIVMANQEPPSDPGRLWVVESSHQYFSGGKARYFWAFAPVNKLK